MGGKEVLRVRKRRRSMSFIGKEWRGLKWIKNYNFLFRLLGGRNYLALILFYFGIQILLMLY